MRSSQLQQLARLLIMLQVVVATMLLAMGEGSWLLLAVTLVVVGVSLYVTDTRKWFRLTQSMADIVALTIMALTAIAAIRSDRQGLLVLVANLQSYLQYVLFFQVKSTRVYWQLALLSLGQMAIASTLVPGPSFGFWLLVYMLLGLVGFATLLLSNESPSDRAAKGDGGAPPASPGTLAGSARMSLVGSTVAIEPRLLWKNMVLTVLAVFGLTTFSAGMIFFSLPRWGTESYEVTMTEPLRTVGFTNTVMLGELGAVVNNPEVVMRATFYRGRGDRPVRLIGEPLFRGSVLTRYEGRTWTQPRASFPVPLPTEAGSPITRQRISIEPLDVSDVFHVAPAVVIDQVDPRLKVDPDSDQLMRLDELRSRALEFDIGTTGIRGNRQRTVLRSEEQLTNSEQATMRQPFSSEPTENPFPELTGLAAEILAEKGIDPQADRVAAARALSDHFHLSGEFFYSLDPIERDVDLDPLEDFVSQHRGGHCEYFAGALVMMLRSQGIPARMVIGFKGGEWNEVGHYYQVQQLHAHAWVEAYLERDQIPQAEFAGESLPEAAWLVLDPTEGTHEGSSAQVVGLLGRLRQSIDYGRVLWINYVASLNAKRQRQGIYEPLAAGVEAAVLNVTSVEVWQERLRALEESRLGRFWRWYRRHWFSWRGGLVAVGFSLFLVAVTMGLRAMARWLTRRGWLGRKKAVEATPVLEMYRRLEEALARIGLSRDPGQTAHEFAVVAAGHLAERPEHRPLAPLPSRIIDAFYRVRFGGRKLDKPEEKAVENALSQLELALARPR